LALTTTALTGKNENSFRGGKKESGCNAANAASKGEGAKVLAIFLDWGGRDGLKRGSGRGVRRALKTRPGRKRRGLVLLG